MKEYVEGLIEGIQTDNRDLVLSSFREISEFKNLDEEKKSKIVFNNLSKFGIVRKDDEEKITTLLEGNMSRVSEDDLIGLVDYIHGKKSDIFKEYRKAVGIDEHRENLEREIISDKDLFNSMLTRGNGAPLRAPDLKEAVGWVAGYINSDNFSEESVVFYGDGNEINKRQTLKNILKEINNLSMTSSMPFQVKLSKEDKMVLNCIKEMTEEVDGKRAKKKGVFYTDVIGGLVDKGKIPPYARVKTEKSKTLRIKIKKIVENIDRMKDQKINEWIDSMTSFKFHPAGSGEVDVLLRDNNKILGMSITTDLGTEIEQNQFFRHYLKTAVISSFLKEGEDINQVKNKEIEVIRRGEKTQKRLSDASFFEILNYWRNKNGYSVGDRNTIDNNEIEQIVKDASKQCNFIFFGEINENIKPEMREEVASFLMLSYVSNLRGIGNVDMDIQAAFNFLDKVVDARFNGVDNKKPYIREGVKRAVDFLIETDEKNILPSREDNRTRKYSEGNIYKTERENVMNGLSAFTDIVSFIYTRSKEQGTDFRGDLRKFLVEDNNVEEKTFNKFYKKIISGELKDSVEKKIRGIRKSESETSKAANILKDKLNLMGIILSNDSSLIDNKKKCRQTLS